ncbi:MAG: hypothetical protein M1823_000916 [Watsoniomyces obsoletus]|nr:MAG: hypothetical protein M1823_000916 [Watsoniomyces obsoletus]
MSVLLPLTGDKPVASGYGVVLYIALAEPVLFLRGCNRDDSSSRSSAMLRGNLVMRVTKCVKVKTINLNFRGIARTEWPEGIPPKRVEFFEEEMINRHTWTFFNALYPHAETGHGADYARQGFPPGITAPSAPSAALSAFDQLVRSVSPAASSRSSRQERRRSLQMMVLSSNQSGESERQKTCSNTTQKGYRTFAPGDYVYHFELPLDSHLPETINVDSGSVKYELEAVVERAGAFRSSLSGTQEVTLIRTPAENSLEQVEPIAISRDWENQLRYDIVISGKSFPLGAQVPIAFKLTPLAKIQCHRIRIYVTEAVEYFCSNQKVHRLEPSRKVQLFEKRADGPSISAFPGSSVRVLAGGGVNHDALDGNKLVEKPRSYNLLGDIDGGINVGPTEMEFSVQLPGCPNGKEGEKSPRISFDTTFSNIRVHHWIKIVMRLSKSDPANPGKRRHFEISIDSPLHILSCLATQANTALPAYSPPTPHPPDARRSFGCQCPGGSTWRPSTPGSSAIFHAQHSSISLTDGVHANGARENVSTAFAGLAFASTAVAGLAFVPHPPAAHVHDEASQPLTSRPMHLSRYPSYDPPAFDAEQPPRPFLSPPPRYETVVNGDGTGLADYFSRLADEMGDESPVDDAELLDGVTGRSLARLNLPLTPGGRVHRSMDERRTWLPPGGVT